jgi:hypothetical protein
MKKKKTLSINNPFSKFVSKNSNSILAIFLMMRLLSAGQPIPENFADHLQDATSVSDSSSQSQHNNITQPPQYATEAEQESVTTAPATLSTPPQSTPTNSQSPETTTAAVSIATSISSPPTTWATQPPRTDRPPTTRILATPKSNPDVVRLQNELATLRANSNHSDQEIAKLLGHALSEHNPLLVGRNIIFSEKFLTHLPVDGLDGISEEMWLSLREKLDRGYDALFELTGVVPSLGQRLYIDIWDTERQNSCAFHNGSNELDRNISGHAHRGEGYICLTPKTVSSLLTDYRFNGSVNHTVLHEISHKFDYEDAINAFYWKAEGESFANFKVAYMLDNVGMKARRGNDIFDAAQYRAHWFNQADERRRSEVIQPFAKDGGTTHSALDFYLYGLVEQVGWNPIKQTFRSYNNSNFQNEYHFAHPAIDWRGATQLEKSREFFERIKHFSNRPNILTSLPDNGILLNQHFNVEPTRVNISEEERQRLHDEQRQQLLQQMQQASQDNSN